MELYDKNSKKVFFGLLIFLWVLVGGFLFLYGIDEQLYFISAAVVVVSIPLLIFLLKALARAAADVGGGIQKQVEFIEKQFKDDEPS